MMAKIKVLALIDRVTIRWKSRTSRRSSSYANCSFKEGDTGDIQEAISHQVSLTELPYDVLLEVFMYLDVRDVLKLAQTSHTLYDTSECIAIWQGLARKLMCRGRRISLHDQLSPSTLSAAQLRQSVIAATAAEHSWSTEKAPSVASPRIVQLKGVDLDHASYVMKFTSCRHLVLPTKAGELVGWDTQTKVHAGAYNMGVDTVLINVQGEYATRSLYWITGKMSLDFENAQNLHLTILRIQFPEPDESAPIVFEDLAEIITPWSLAAELHFLDVSRRMFCAVFSCDGSGTTGLHVILDWNTGLSYLFDTGIPYEYGRAVIGLNLSSDGSQLVLHSEFWGCEVRRSYSLETLRAYASIWDPSRDLSQSLPVMTTSSKDTFSWVHDRSEFTNGEMAPHTVWVLPQWWPTLPGVPLRTSTIILYLSTTADGTKSWRAAQHYSLASGREGEGQAGPCAPARSVVDIADPVLISLGQSGLPILAQSFNHLGWIEERPIGARGRLRWAGRRKGWLRRERSMRRVLKVVTFPDPGISPVTPCCEADENLGGDPYNCDCTTLKPVTLDIPESVLNDVYHMFLDPAAGTITLATHDNELHVYQYGRTLPMLTA